MKRLRAIIVAKIFVAVSLFSGCSTPEVAKPGAASGNGKYYSVVKSTPFYHYGPLLGNGPDQTLSQDTLVRVVRPVFEYCEVRLVNGEQGYVASEDIHVASPALVAAATAPPRSITTDRISKSPIHSNAPSPTAPPEFLPIDSPEPTPIPGIETYPPP